MATILVVDDELGIRDLLFEILNDEGHQVELAMNAAEARAIRAQLQPDLVLLDIWMPDTDGITLLKEWAGAGLLNVPVIMMSGHATIDTAVQATRIGAMAFLEKPITMQKLLKAVEQGLNRKAGAPVTARAVQSLLPVVSATLSQDGTVSPSLVHQPQALPQNMQPLQTFDLNNPLREAREVFEREYLVAQLNRFSNNISRTAEFIGMERSALHRKLKSLSVDS